MGNLYRFVEPVALLLLQTKGKTHGYDLAGALNEYALSDSLVEPGALYRTLRRLEEHGYVVSTWEVSGAGPARRIYELTPAGTVHLQEWAEVLDRLSQSLGRFVLDVRSATGENHSGV
jgi:DNA-binding PadR family transcriptional regulator